MHNTYKTPRQFTVNPQPLAGKVAGLRDSEPPTEVRVYDAATGVLKRTEEAVPFRPRFNNRRQGHGQTGTRDTAKAIC